MSPHLNALSAIGRLSENRRESWLVDVWRYDWDDAAQAALAARISRATAHDAAASSTQPQGAA